MTDENEIAIRQAVHLADRLHVAGVPVDLYADTVQGISLLDVYKRQAMSTRLSLTGLSPSLAGFPKTVLLGLSNQFRGPNPRTHALWFGLFRFRSPLLPESLLFSLPLAT